MIKLFRKYGYEVIRQKGSHIRLSKTSEEGTHNLTIPNHNPIRLGTLNAILSDAADQLKTSKD
ncbi:MAG TPA: type II toxin-antitoxin system HicA family toxin, partial [Mucilaginibacter sp.]|nr:type II toxin-antitoxin system HicA family toxin [Mucilaginibacter sp.]